MVSGIGGTPPTHAHGPERRTGALERVKRSGAAGASDEDGQPGVIRNLLNGHYKGVADVRLRIVHADAIAAMQATADARFATETRETLRAGLDAAVDAFAARAGVTGDGAVDAAVASAVETFKEAIATPKTDLAAAIDTLEEALYAAVSPFESGLEMEEVGTEGAEPDGLAADDPIAALLASLRDMVQSSLEGGISEALLPPVSGYEGNGRAYARFLAVYEAMNTPAATDPGTENEGAIDLSA